MGLEAKPSDDALLERIVQRDVDAFEALYRRHHARLAALVRRLTRCAELADEIANEALLVVWQKASSFRRQAQVSTWLCGIAYRLALKRLTRARTTPTTVDLDDAVLVEPISPEHLAVEAERHRRLLAGMARLPAAQRAVIELTFVHGCSYAEIAALLECPVGTVKTRMFHARARLKAVIGDNECDERETSS